MNIYSATQRYPLPSRPSMYICANHQLCMCIHTKTTILGLDLWKPFGEVSKFNVHSKSNSIWAMLYLPETEYSPVQGFSNNFQLSNSVTHSVSVTFLITTSVRRFKATLKCFLKFPEIKMWRLSPPAVNFTVARSPFSLERNSEEAASL